MQPESRVRCESGLICFGDEVCGPTGDRCADPERIAACQLRDESQPCTTSVGSGLCTGGVCEVAICGDGVVAAPEECDIANDIHGELLQCVGRGFSYGRLACSATCNLEDSACATLGFRRINAPELYVAPRDVWADGDGGFMMLAQAQLFKLGLVYVFDGQAWTRYKLDQEAQYSRLAVHSKTDAWAFGDAAVYHFDGATWTLATVPPELVGAEVKDTWQSGTSTFLLTKTGVVARSSALGWEVEATLDGDQSSANDSMEAIAGFSEDALYVAGTLDGSRVVYRRDAGGTWSPLAEVPAFDVLALETHQGQLFAGGKLTDKRAQLARLVGNGWQPEPFLVGASASAGISLASNGSQLFAGLNTPEGWSVTGTMVMLHDGQWFDMSTGQELIVGVVRIVASNQSVLAVTSGLYLLEWRGRGVSQKATVFDASGDVFGELIYGTLRSGLDGSIFLNVSEFDQSYLTRRVGGEYETLDVVPAGHGVVSHAPVSANQFYMFTAALDAPTQTGGALGVVVDDVYSELVANLPVRARLAFANNSLYVGPDGYVFRLDDDQLVDLGIPENGFVDFLWHSGTSLYVVLAKVFGGGSLWRWDGASWSLALESDKRFGRLWGASDDDLWLPEQDGALYRFDGAEWTQDPQLSNRFIVGLTGTSADSVFAFNGAEVWHHDGVGWAPVALGETGYLEVMATPSAFHFIGGNGGAFAMPMTN